MDTLKIEKGQIRAYYFVTCGKCGKEESLGTTVRANVPFHLERGGWEHRIKYGYVCSECLPKGDVR